MEEKYQTINPHPTKLIVHRIVFYQIRFLRKFCIATGLSSSALANMSIKLRDLIRAVRACKTAAEERAVISKECALIRTAIKEEDEQFRHRNVAKLMFIHMLGYPTHFGQMECLKLISAPGFPEKRIGYLALTLLLTEQTEVLTLVTNSLKLDLTNSNQYIQALSLIAIGNLATQDMARDLVSDVEKLLKSNNSYLRKKAALAAIRLVKKEPDLLEGMEDRIVALLKDRNHGVLISGLQLIMEVINELPQTKPEYTKLVPSLTRLLRNFISMGFSPEHDVSGITDPFMQVKILRLLRVLGKSNEEASEQMNDVLAQVATNTETTKNAGNAILYECVQTIMDVESDSSLKVLAINILGRFLLNRDNNIRYVALNSLSKVVSEDNAAVQRHRNTIVDCLKDPDISIRQRALDLIYQLVNDQNVVLLTTELLNYLVVAQTDHKVSLSSKIMQIVEKYSPNKKWRVDTVITMLTVAGNITDESVPRTAIIFIAQADGLQAYATHRLFRALLEETAQLGLLQVAVWCIGEYGSLLTRDCPAPDTDSAGYNGIPEQDIVNLLDKCSRSHNADTSIKALVVNALMKLTIRFSPAVKQGIIDLIAPYKHSMSLELQQRSCEYSVLLGAKWENLRREVLDKMPVLDESTIRRRRAAFDENNGSGDVALLGSSAADFTSGSILTSTTTMAPQASNSSNSLLDLDDIFGGGAAPVKAAAPSSSNHDLLSDIFSGPAASPPMIQMNVQPIISMNANPPVPPVANLDLLSLSSIPPPSMPAISSGMPMIATSPNCNIVAFDKNGFQILMEASKPNAGDPAVTRVFCKFVNMTSFLLEGLIFQVSTQFFFFFM